MSKSTTTAKPRKPAKGAKGKPGPSITPEQKAAARRATAKPSKPSKPAPEPPAEVATKRVASLIEVGDRIGRKMAGPFEPVTKVEPSKSGETIRLTFGESTWSPKAKTDVWVLVPTGTERGAKPSKAKPTKPSKPAPDTTPTVDVAQVLPGYIVNYVEQHGSQDPMAPMHGDPFVQAGRLYLQLEGRGGAGKQDDVATTTGLRPFLRDTNGGLGDQPKKILQNGLADLGFTRKPFPYLHPDRGSTAASYYSRDLEGFPGEITIEPRQTKRDQRAAKRATEVANPALAEAPIPMQPAGSPEDVERLNALWAAYNDAREAWKAAGTARAPKDEQDEKMQATRAANAELLAHRKAMVAKLASKPSE